FYQSIEETAETCNTRAEYLRTLTEAVYLPAGEYAQAEATCQAWMALMQAYGDQVTSTRWMLIDGRGILLSIYAATEQHDRVKETITAGRLEALDYAQWFAEQQARVTMRTWAQKHWPSTNRYARPPCTTSPASACGLATMMRPFPSLSGRSP
ncbi:MAG: hypothetical protein GWN58_40205, partial [Anaerolineae bacterium]|nr:hypothetical protein [Anaerolineae bacterium]